MKIYFDGACPLCSREMLFVKRKDKANLIELIDIANPDFSAEQIGKSKTELMARIHAMLPDNRLIDGVEVFREVYNRIGMGWLLWITTVPGFKQMADISYNIFAKHRIKISRLFSKCTSGSCSIS